MLSDQVKAPPAVMRTPQISPTFLAMKRLVPQRFAVSPIISFKLSQAVSFHMSVCLPFRMPPPPISPVSFSVITPREQGIAIAPTARGPCFVPRHFRPELERAAGNSKCVVWRCGVLSCLSRPIISLGLSRASPDCSRRLSILSSVQLNVLVDDGLLHSLRTFFLIGCPKARPLAKQ